MSARMHAQVFDAREVPRAETAHAERAARLNDERGVCGGGAADGALIGPRLIARQMTGVVGPA